MAEGLAMFRVGEGYRENVFGRAHRERAELEAPDVQNIEGDDMPAARLAQQISDGKFYIIEEDRGGGTSLDAHLLLFRARGDTGKGALDEKRGKLLAIELRKDGEEI